MIPITVGRAKSTKLIQEAQKGNKLIGVVAQKDGTIEEPEFDDLYQTGVMAYIVKVLTMPDESTTVIIQGRNRIFLEEMVSEDPFFVAKVKSLPTDSILDRNDHFNALLDSIKDLSLKAIQLNPNIPVMPVLPLKI